MAVDDIGDELADLRELQRRVDRIESGTMLENASITRGRLRIIGGLLRIDSGGRLEVIGDWRFVGNGAITGDVVAEGKWTQNGAWEFNGPGDISGDVAISGDLDLTGDLEVLGGGRIKVGNVILTPGDGGRITIGTGASQIIIDPSQLKVGPAFKMDPAHSSTGAQMAFGLTGKSTIYGDDQGVQIVNNASTPFFNLRVLNDGYYLDNVPDKPTDKTARYLGIGTDGKLYRMSSGGGGDPGDPPAGNPNGYIWPADPAVYGISDNFAAHVARGSAEPGVDVMTPVGAPLWAPGAGTIVAVNNSPTTAMGRYVTLVTTEGDWFRFLHNSAVVVGVGDTVEQAQLLAYTGGSGFGQEAYYGPHSHISFKAGYTGIFPGATALDDFQAYMAAQ